MPRAPRPNRASINFSADSLDVLRKFNGDHPETRKNLSAGVDSIIHRYHTLILKSTPSLTQNQWHALCEANSGGYPFPDQSMAGPMVIANFSDSPELGEKWDIDHPALTQQLLGMHTANLLAILEVIESFWRNNHLPADEALAAAGAKVTDA